MRPIVSVCGSGGARSTDEEGHVSANHAFFNSARVPLSYYNLFAPFKSTSFAQVYSPSPPSPPPPPSPYSASSSTRRRSSTSSWGCSPAAEPSPSSARSPPAPLPPVPPHGGGLGVVGAAGSARSDLSGGEILSPGLPRGDGPG